MYGPYAVNLRQVLIRLEQHYTSGYGDGKDDPTKPIQLLPGAVQEAESFLANAQETLARINRVSRLIDGYEDPYGLELLSSVHWVIKHDQEAARDSNVAFSRICEWTARKRKTMKPEHVKKAWDRLHEQSWIE